MKAVILAGGSGTRLWPMSRRQRPKQFFDVIGSEPLICDAYRRLLQVFTPEQILFSTSPGFDRLIHEHFSEIPSERILVEPERRDTGPAMGYVAALLELQDPDEPIVFIPSDHYIGDDGTFLRCLSVGDALIRETGKLLDIAIHPAFPSTVLGYTRIGEPVETREGIHVFRFAGHTEKPSLEKATAYLQEGSYLWHANYYMWTPRRFMEAFECYAPDMGRTLRQIQVAVRDGSADEVAGLYAALPKISLDYAVTEKMAADDVLILRGDFGWSDIGAWDTLYDRLAPEGGNVTKGSPLLLDTEGSLVYAPAGKRVAVVGMRDTVVVDTGDVLLVCPRDQAQRVKEIVSRLEAEGDMQAL
ncbi:mannose-1-phosphate guanylyltransferase [Candidatus Uhrbacteria bacterium]|nr:mannose-1-phosphate guanylyltransferase [Candidatus Uhrbacteria bacterium]MBI4598577.1 mannose-1-phosphate guanylyltransferase [Candidatus Uhrbacteria bacterium]